jgi:hypothetical protein
VVVSRRPGVFHLTDFSGGDSSSEGEVTAQLKGSCHVICRKNEKIPNLTILANSWSITKIQQQFKASNYTIQTAKKLVTEKGILSSPNAKSSKVLPLAIAEIVKQKG